MNQGHMKVKKEWLQRPMEEECDKKKNTRWLTWWTLNNQESCKFALFIHLFIYFIIHSFLCVCLYVCLSFCPHPMFLVYIRMTEDNLSFRSQLSSFYATFVSWRFISYFHAWWQASIPDEPISNLDKVVEGITF